MCVSVLALQFPCVAHTLVQLLQQDLCPNDFSWGIVMVVEEYPLTKSAIITGVFIPVGECHAERCAGRIVISKAPLIHLVAYQLLLFPSSCTHQFFHWFFSKPP